MISFCFDPGCYVGKLQRREGGGERLERDSFVDIDKRELVAQFVAYLQIAEQPGKGERLRRKSLLLSSLVFAVCLKETATLV